MTNRRTMSHEQRKQLQELLAASVPELSFLEAESAIQANGTLLQGIRAAFEPFLRAPRIRSSSNPVTSNQSSDRFSLDVEYAGEETLRQLLKLGKYDWMNNDVSDKNFPQKKTGRESITLRLVNFERVVSTKDVLAELKQARLRPANPAEILVLGAKHPEIQQQFPIIALGQNWLLPNRDRMVVCLAWHSMLRRVHLLCQYRRDWPMHCRFAAVEK